jgi:hypothetical protein
MSIKDKYTVRSIEPFQCKEWILKKHYAKRMPTIEYSYGLYELNILIGICTFGCPPRVMNNGESIFKIYRVKTFELNRLCTNEGLEKNSLSFFVSSCLKMLPKPCCVVSYSDYTFGHNGYIYQATNWIYTGLNQIHEREWFLEGKEIHQRTLSGKGLTSAKEKVKIGMVAGDYTKKHRYFKFLGNKNQVNSMRTDLIFKIEPYPKGDNKRYNADYKPHQQSDLFNE